MRRILKIMLSIISKGDEPVDEKKGLEERMRLSVEEAYDRVLKPDAYAAEKYENREDTLCVSADL